MSAQQVLKRSMTKRTTDHQTIRRWVEERAGQPSRVEATADAESILLHIDFPGDGGEETLQPITWDAFFTTFERANLALLYQERTDSGAVSYFNKFVHRDI